MTKWIIVANHHQLYGPKEEAEKKFTEQRNNTLQM